MSDEIGNLNLKKKRLSKMLYSITLLASAHLYFCPHPSPTREYQAGDYVNCLRTKDERPLAPSLSRPQLALCYSKPHRPTEQKTISASCVRCDFLLLPQTAFFSIFSSLSSISFFFLHNPCPCCRRVTRQRVDRGGESVVKVVVW